MSDYNVDCPKHYGKITFVGANTNYCPVSGMNTCVDCDVIPSKDLDDDSRQVKRVPSKKF